MPTPDENKILSNLRAVQGQLELFKRQVEMTANTYAGHHLEALEQADYFSDRGQHNKAMTQRDAAEDAKTVSNNNAQIALALSTAPALATTEARLFALEKKIDLLLEAITK
jgi:hypothetical protein